MAHSQKVKNLIEIFPEEAQTLELLIKDIKLNMFDELQETTNIDLKRVGRMMYEQRMTVKSRNYIKVPHRNSGTEKYYS